LKTRAASKDVDEIGMENSSGTNFLTRVSNKATASPRLFGQGMASTTPIPSPGGNT
jgi:hypothetical protein